MFWKRKNTIKMIPVLPKNYRSICIQAVEVSSEPVVIMDKKVITDYSDQGRLTQSGIKECRNFEIRDGHKAILGFHDHPNEMWISEQYEDFARHCEKQGWLKIEGSAS